MKICEYIGGSHLYCLNTASSDVDKRFVFLNTEFSEIIGLERHDSDCKQTKGEDSAGWELRHFLRMCRKCNSAALEALFNEDWVHIDPLFKSSVLDNRLQLIDSKNIYFSLRGYLKSELNASRGRTTGKLGAIRKGQIEKYGYSPKSMMNAIRLALTGERFFKDNVYSNKPEAHFRETLLRIKTDPEGFNADDLERWVEDLEESIKHYFKERNQDYKFDNGVANEICKQFYLPFLIS
jgi:predicted nucleotidyltransferase